MESDFRRKILKVNLTRRHKIKKSWGVYDAYKYIRRNKWFNIGRPLKEGEFYKIIRLVNKYLCDSLINMEDIKFPCRMGSLETRKYKPYIRLEGNNIKTNLPPDWNRTIELWSKDEEAYNNKTIVKMEEKEVFKVWYNKSRANFKNKSFYHFEVNRDLKIRLKQVIKEGSFDAFNF